jgi:hypothetical protein
MNDVRSYHFPTWLGSGKYATGVRKLKPKAIRLDATDSDTNEWITNISVQGIHCHTNSKSAARGVTQAANITFCGCVLAELSQI